MERNMLTVVIIEDEYYVRKGLIKSTNWEALDCTVVGEAANGREGIEVIKETNPDVVMTDIKMPIMDGIEMVRTLKRFGISAEYIFLTAHSEFSYAHNALKLDAADYLLKPIEYEALSEAINRVKQRIRLKTNAPSKEESELLPDSELASANLYVRKALQYIRENYSSDITLSSAAASLNISEGYFSRIFKKETDYTFGNYLIQYRCQIAKGLLKNFQIKIYEVAAQVGYTDTNYFSMIFKKTVGVSPTEYQKQVVG